MVGTDGANDGPRRLTPVEFYDSRDLVIRRVINPMAVNEEALPLTTVEDAAAPVQQEFNYADEYKFASDKHKLNSDEVAPPVIVDNATHLKQATGKP